MKYIAVHENNYKTRKAEIFMQSKVMNKVMSEQRNLIMTKKMKAS